jgi:hypothetical protein
MAVLIALTRRAVREDDPVWLKRFEWFGDIFDELTNDEPGQPLDG